MISTENVILVDPEDHPMGEIEKITAHRYAMLHRAFSVFVFRRRNNKLELLLQQRNKTKYHSGGLWTNTCCSHPHPGEDLIQSAEKRLKNEMGIAVKLKAIGKFHYVAPFANGLTENEIDHVLIGNYNANDILINPDEVQTYRWISITALQHDLATHPKKYTPWFKQALTLVLPSIEIF